MCDLQLILAFIAKNSTIPLTENEVAPEECQVLDIAQGAVLSPLTNQGKLYVNCFG